MSALSPVDPGHSPADAGEAQARLQALEAELQALRAENDHLRRRLAQRISGSDGDVSLPVPLDMAQGTNRPASTAQHEYEGLLAALASVFPIGVFRIDSSGLLTHVDAALQRIFGLDAQDFINLGWLRLIHPQDRERVERHWADNVTRSNSLNIEFRLVRPDGELVHALVRNVPLAGADGQHQGHLGFVQDITSLRTLQEDARIQEELNRQIIANSPDCTKVLDLQGHLQQITERGLRLVQADSLEQVQGTDWSKWWKGESESSVRAALEQARHGETARFVAFGETFKGTPKWWDTVISPIRNERGEPMMLLAVSRDITDQYRQQEEIRQLNAELERRVRERTEALAETNERLVRTLKDVTALYNQAPCGYHSVNAQGIIENINQTELDWLGYQREDVIGRLHFHDMVDAVDKQVQTARLQRLIDGLPVDPVELQLVGIDGRRRDVLVSTTAVYDETGRFVCTNSTLVDISARKAAEHALQAQTQLLQSVSDAVPAQIALYDRQLICRFANASYARWLSSTPDHLLGLHLSQIARPQDYEANLPRLLAALAGEPQSLEGERQIPGSEPFVAAVSYTPYVAAGEVQGLIIQMVDVTERRSTQRELLQLNAQLQDALDRLQSLYDDAPCGYHSVNADGIYVSINRTELEWLGYEREEVVGRLSHRDFVADGRTHEPGDRLARLIQHGRLEPAEYLVRRRDGSTFHALVSTSAVFDAQGRFVQSNSTLVDISQRKAAEEALREHQHMLQTVADSMPGLIAYLDTMLRYRFANIAFQRFYQLHPAAIIGIHASEVLPAGTWNEVLPHLGRALAGEPQHFESWRNMADGQSRYMRTSYLPEWRDGRVQGVFAQVVDITDRKHVEERVRSLNEELEVKIRERSLELLESEQRFRLMVDNLRDYCIFFLDAQGHVTDWTDSAQRMEGDSPTEMLGRHYAVLFNREEPAKGMEAANQMLRLAASRGQHEMQAWHRRKDGSEYWSHSVLIALRDDDGELKGFAKINRDMSDAKRLDDLMRNINDELENRVASRTEQLLAANKDLESFSYSVSHDLRSPLRHISSFVSLLEEHLQGQLDDTAQKYLGTIGSSARHMSQLIDGLLAFSRLGRAAVNLTPVDFSQLVDAVVTQLAHDTQGRVVDWVIAPDLPVVQGDALLLREVWANLLGNAFKYTRPRERARIEVSWSVDPAVGYTFNVCDNGVGFDTKYAQKLFGVFQRLHRASEFEGTGIGLALTRRILERHGGSIWAESQVGQGSVFHFSLPFEGFSPTEAHRDTMPSVLEP